jgi:hypothetical protein
MRTWGLPSAGWELSGSRQKPQDAVFSACDRPDSGSHASDGGDEPPLRRPRQAGFIAWPLAVLILLLIVGIAVEFFHVGKNRSGIARKPDNLFQAQVISARKTKFPPLRPVVWKSVSVRDPSGNHNLLVRAVRREFGPRKGWYWDSQRRKVLAWWNRTFVTSPMALNGVFGLRNDVRGGEIERSLVSNGFAVGTRDMAVVVQVDGDELASLIKDWSIRRYIRSLAYMQSAGGVFVGGKHRVQLTRRYGCVSRYDANSNNFQNDCGVVHAREIAPPMPESIKESDHRWLEALPGVLAMLMGLFLIVIGFCGLAALTKPSEALIMLLLLLVGIPLFSYGFGFLLMTFQP